MMAEKYFSLKSTEGPKEQIGVAIRATSELRLEDLTRLFSFVKSGKGKEHQSYEANTNIDLFGKDREGEKDIIGLRVFGDARVEIYKQAAYPMRIEEITKDAAEEAARRMNDVRQQRMRPAVISISAGNPALGIEPGTYRY